jgi:hypothetical protein
MMNKSKISLFMVQLVVVVAAISLFNSQVSAQSPAKWEYVSPRPGSQYISPGTTIAIRPGEVLDEKTVNSDLFTVTGTQSGSHRGSAILSDDKKTVIFKPLQPFAKGEKVYVVVNPGFKTITGRTINDLSFSFTILLREVALPPDLARSLLDAHPQAAAPDQPNIQSPSAQQFVTLPPDYPPLTVTTAPNGTADGDIFLAPFAGNVLTTTYALILDQSGQPVYYKKLAGVTTDFKKQPDGRLTYYNGGIFYAMDSSYNIVDTYQAGNGYPTDLHDLQVLPNGHALLLIYNPQVVDMSQIISGGYQNAAVVGLMIQELDTSKNVVFEWRSWDHFLITDTQVSLTTPDVDYVHGNAVELDSDGNLLISSRNMSEITKINRQTGDIIWRWGGKRNQFTFVNDPAPDFGAQHDIRRQPNGHVTFFDNRWSTYSRAVEYQLDENAKIATLVWEYRHTPDVWAPFMGNTQRLNNGNTLIGWGGVPLVTEVKSDGSKVFELNLAPNVNYRAFRFPWHGYPTTQPTLVIQTTTFTTTLTYSWNGATDIDSYRVYGGNQYNPTTLIMIQPKAGFETSSILGNILTGCRYFRVMPIDTLGKETQYSNEVSADCHSAASIHDRSIVEGDTLTKTAAFTVTLSAANVLTTSIEYATSDGTAIAGVDYVSSTGVLVFPPGEVSAVINIPIIGNIRYEADKTFFVNLNNASNATIDGAQGAGLILNDDPPPALSINDASVLEGNTGTVTATFTVTLSSASVLTATVDYSTTNGTAIAGVDYIPVSGVLSFAPGQVVQTISVPIINDILHESDETFSVTLSGPVNAILIDDHGHTGVIEVAGMGVIIDNDYGVYLPFMRR